MALEGLRSAARRLADTMTATPPIVSTPDADAAPRGEPPIAGGLEDVGGPTFPCPACARPLERGTGRCFGCGQRMVLDVAASRASMLLGAGIMVGLLAGILRAALVIAPGAVTAPTQPLVAATPAPGIAGAGATVSPEALATAAAALRGTTALNDRLAAAAPSLSKALAAKKLSTADVVQILRAMRTDTRAAAGMVGALGGWPAASAHGASLATFYAKLADEIDTGLAAPLRSTTPYRNAGKAILRTLAGVPVLDAEARGLAAGAGMELPAVPPATQP